jgi:hypothetical protein
VQPGTLDDHRKRSRSGSCRYRLVGRYVWPWRPPQSISCWLPFSSFAFGHCLSWSRGGRARANRLASHPRTALRAKRPDRGGRLDRRFDGDGLVRPCGATRRSPLRRHRANGRLRGHQRRLQGGRSIRAGLPLVASGNHALKQEANRTGGLARSAPGIVRERGIDAGTR